MKYFIIGAILLIGLGYGGAKIFLYYKVSNGMEFAVEAVSPYMDLKYQGISSTITGELTIDDVRISIKGFRDEIFIRRLGINTPSFQTLLQLSKLASGSQNLNSGLPEYFGLIADGIRIPSNADYYRTFFNQSMEWSGAIDLDQAGVECVGKYGMFSPEALAAFGYEEQVISLSIIFRQIETEFIIEAVADVDDMYDLEMSVALVGDLMSELSRGASYRPKLKSLRIDYTDRSLNKRIRKYCAQLGLTSGQTLAAHLDALNYFGETNGIVFDDLILNPYKEFLAGKPRLVITANPVDPVDFAEIAFYNPTDVPALLNLAATAQ